MEDGVITLENYVLCIADVVGRGGFGTVYKGKNSHDGTTVAIKQCVIASEKHGFQAMKEVKNFQQLENHPNIVHLFDFYYRNSAFWFVMEFCDAGDLTRYMKEVNPNLDEMLELMYHCARAIAHMHTRKNLVIHRDIKPANILLKREHERTVLKVTDFGLSKILEHDPMKNYNNLTHAGTPAFMAPEVFMHEKYTESVDVFSLGLVFHCMLNFKPGDRELIPAFANQGILEQMLPIGAQLGHCIKGNKTYPPLVTEDPRDAPKVISLKHLISEMSTGLSKDRPSMQKVEHEIGVLAGYKTSSDIILRSGSSASGSTYSQSQQACEKPNEVIPKPVVSQSCIPKQEEQTEDMGILKEALEKVIQEQMSSVTEKSPDAEKDKKHPYKEFLDGVFEDPSTKNSKSEESSRKIQAGDRVVVDPDEERVKLLQIDHGEYIDPMKRYLGREGLVRDRFSHICKVQFDDGQVWSLNPEALLPTGEVQQVPISETVYERNQHSSRRNMIESMFNRYDVVVMPKDEDLVKCLQHSHGGWNTRMRNCLGVKGIVNKIHDGGDVFVEFINGDDWTVNAELLTHVNTKEGDIETGDFVMIHSDRERVMQAQEKVGNWESTMIDLLGKTGMVESILDGNALIEIQGKGVMWSFTSLILVAKREEFQSAVKTAQASLYSFP